MKIRKMKAGSSSGKSAVSPKPSPKTPGSAGSTASSATSTATVSADKKIKDMLRELHRLITQVQSERDRSDHNLANISKTHERIQQEAKNSISPYYKSKLKGLYNTAMQDAESESDLLRSALEKIAEIKAFSKERTGDRPKPMRRGVLMTMLQQSAQTLPLWIGKPGEKPPPLCGAIPAEPNYIARPGDTVAARVKSADEEENWILAEVVSYNTNTNRYEVDDIDAEDGVERHTLSKRRVVPLPIYKANPETDPDSLFPNNTLVLALYPQTTCFYRALIHEPPHKPKDDYSVLFEDTSYPDGYSPPLHVAQRYVIACKEDKKK